MRVGRFELEQDLYAILGVSRSATRAEIRRAHRKLALRYHPDRSQPDAIDADVQMKRVNLAADVLLDALSRARYDQRYGAPVTPAPQPRRPHVASAEATSPPSARPARAPEPRGARRRGGPSGAFALPPSLLAVALILTALTGIFAEHTPGPIPVSSPRYKLPTAPTMVTMFAEP